jgi:AcrR family transcriptional regulator
LEIAMRYSAEHTKETRTRIVDAAGRLFRAQGYGGSGIDGLTKAAGVTNGAFYGHFKSKGEAFRTAVVTGLRDLRAGIAQIKAAEAKDWLVAFIDFYLGPKRTCEVGESCTLPNLSPDVMRSDDETRTAYQAELIDIIGEISSGLPGSSEEQNDDDAIALLALLAGGVTLARAVTDPALSERIARAVKRAALTLQPVSQPV